jgi:gp16 family phage-associated protein
MDEITSHKELLSPQEVLARFQDNGLSISSWATANGYSPALVHAILKDRRKCLRGQSYSIAVSLGLRPRSSLPLPGHLLNTKKDART